MSGCFDTGTPRTTDTAPPAILIDYQRSGGIAGMQDRIVIFDNGITLISGRAGSYETRLNQTQLDRLTRLFDAAKFSSLDANYTSRHGGADLFQYILSYRGKTVHTEDTAIPPALQPVLDEMNQILSTGAGGREGGSPIPRFTL